jgi:hypothetical protein
VCAGDVGFHAQRQRQAILWSQKLRFQLRHLRQQVLRLRIQATRRIADQYTSGFTREQTTTQFFFQLTDGDGQGRLRQTQAFRRAGDIALFKNGDKGFELAGIHRFFRCLKQKIIICAGKNCKIKCDPLTNFICTEFLCKSL